MDNASFHKTVEVLDAIYEAGVKVLFLPSYSPDFNPIEMDFSVLKANVKRYFYRVRDFEHFGEYLSWIVETFGGKHGQRQFRKCGYIN